MSNNGSGDLQSKYEFNSTWAERIAFLIIVGLAVDISAVFVLEKAFPESVLTISANLLIVAGVWGELIFEKRAKEASDGIVAQANKRAAAANEKAAELKISLEKERAKRLGRALTKEQWDVLQTLRGKITKVRVICDTDVEARYFSGQLTTALRDAGIQIEMEAPKPGNTWRVCKSG
jgi:hypothetical protein